MIDPPSLDIPLPMGRHCLQCLSMWSFRSCSYCLLIEKARATASEQIGDAFDIVVDE